MTITFTPTTNIKEVDVEGYGTVKIRPYGAGEELQIAKNLRELDELQKQAEKLLADAKAEFGEDEEKLPVSFKKSFSKIQLNVARLSDELTQLIQSTITSDDEKIAKRLFAELPMVEIRRLINTALGKGEDAETK